MNVHKRRIQQYYHIEFYSPSQSLYTQAKGTSQSCQRVIRLRLYYETSHITTKRRNSDSNQKKTQCLFLHQSVKPVYIYSNVTTFIQINYHILNATIKCISPARSQDCCSLVASSICTAVSYTHLDVYKRQTL